MQLFSRNRLLMKHIKKGSPEKPGSLEADCLGLEETDGAYIMPMPPIPPMPPMSEAPEPQLQLFFSGLSAMTHSVVSSRPAMEAAFCRAERVT